MKERSMSTLLLLILLVSLLACNGHNKETKPRSSDDLGFALLVVAEGDVSLMRQQWADFHPAAFGTLLRRGDQLNPAPDTRIVVLCDNLRTWTVPPGVPSGLNNGCPLPPEPLLRSGKSLLGRTRTPVEALQSIPYIISPRATELLNRRPTLRWNPVPGAISYTVQVRGGDIDWKEHVQGTKTELTYPGHPPLKEGVSYSLIVEADMGQSSRDEEVKGGGFSILSEEKAQSVEVAEGKVAKLELPAKAEALARAHLYRAQNLVSKAIEILEPLATQEEEEVAIHQTLADLYRQIDLNLLAKPRYQKALDLASTTGNVEAQAAAQAGLGEVHVALVEKEEAIKWLEKARANYEKLGESQRVDQLTERIDEISP
ncbi:MAG: tetratricopeptide repeat protein [Ardenticatenaceae bacterium]